jgi:hypothetical protein
MHLATENYGWWEAEIAFSGRFKRFLVGFNITRFLETIRLLQSIHATEKPKKLLQVFLSAIALLIPRPVIDNSFDILHNNRLMKKDRLIPYFHNRH